MPEQNLRKNYRVVLDLTPPRSNAERAKRKRLQKIHFKKEIQREHNTEVLIYDVFIN